MRSIAVRFRTYEDATGAYSQTKTKHSDTGMAAMRRNVDSKQSMKRPASRARDYGRNGAEKDVLSTDARKAEIGVGRQSPRLTARERDVLRLLCEGLSNKAISRRLSISESTVKCHISSILKELRVRSRLEAVVVARRQSVLAD